MVSLLSRHVSPSASTSLYRTTHTDGRPALIHWTLWSTRHRCAVLLARVHALGGHGPKVGSTRQDDRLPSTVSSELRRSALETLGSGPAWIAYETENGRRF